LKPILKAEKIKKIFLDQLQKNTQKLRFRMVWDGFRKLLIRNEGELMVEEIYGHKNNDKGDYDFLSGETFLSASTHYAHVYMFL
jgi:hypothetical protein